MTIKYISGAFKTSFVFKVHPKNNKITLLGSSDSFGSIR